MAGASKHYCSLGNVRGVLTHLASMDHSVKTLLVVKVSINDFVVRAVALALAEVPEANAVWDAKAEEPKLVNSVDVAIAVATDKGLITPIIREANTKSLKQVIAFHSAWHF